MPAIVHAVLAYRNGIIYYRLQFSIATFFTGGIFSNFNPVGIDPIAWLPYSELRVRNRVSYQKPLKRHG
jgi:hypothetical protein